MTSIKGEVHKQQFLKKNNVKMLVTLTGPVIPPCLFCRSKHCDTISISIRISLSFIAAGVNDFILKKVGFENADAVLNNEGTVIFL